MTRRVLCLLFGMTLLVGCLSGTAIADGDGSGSDILIGARPTDGGIAVSGEQNTPGSVQPASTGPATRVVTCDSTDSAAGCAQAIAQCTRTAPVGTITQGTPQILQTQQPGGGWTTTGHNCDLNGQPHALIVVTPAIARETIMRLLPPVPVETAPDTGPTLVNIQTIFWTPTTIDRDLGTVTILGLPVTIHIRYHHTTYTYGDGTTDTATTPGKPYTPGSCTTPQCPNYLGHTYTHPANTTATAAIAWTATYTVAGQPTQTIPGTITGPTTTHPITIIEARTVLVR